MKSGKMFEWPFTPFRKQGLSVVNFDGLLSPEVAGLFLLLRARFIAE
jgi:hypothetical protein